MAMAFLSRPPTQGEVTKLARYLGTYRDGTGVERESDGSSRANYRQIERCFAELLHGRTSENKAFYDFFLETNDGGIQVHGASVKSKEITKLLDWTHPTKSKKLRGCLELSNSHARNGDLIREMGLTVADFEAKRYPDAFGKLILQRQTMERLSSEKAYLEERGGNRTFAASDSVFILIMYSPSISSERSWLVASFSVHLPDPVEWVFRGKHLAGVDADGGTLYQWYGSSGSQFKYFPKLINRLHGTDLFKVPRPAIQSLSARADHLFGV